MECVTVCTRCELRWEGDFEYCPKCEPVLAAAERRGESEAFTDQDVVGEIALDSLVNSKGVI